MGGGLLQKLNRDTQKFAFKCSSAIVNGEERAVFKDPVTDAGKRSKSGKLKLIFENGSYKTVNANEPGEDLLQTVFENGKMTKELTFDEVRRNAAL